VHLEICLKISYSSLRTLFATRGDKLKIKKQIKRDKARRKRIILVSIIIMVFMPYLVIVLNDQNIFFGWEKYFAYSYAGFIDLLLVVNVLRLIAEDKFDLSIHNQRVKVKEGFIRPVFSIQLDKIVYVDAVQKSKEDFEILIIFNKGKRNKSFLILNTVFVRNNSQYKSAYNYLKNRYPEKEFWCYRIKKAGARKYYYLYLIFKSAYHVEFSQNAIDYIKSFMEEYNLS
jgi:hypothetical protein